MRSAEAEVIGRYRHRAVRHVVSASLAAFLSFGANGQVPGEQGEIRGLRLGLTQSQLQMDPFEQFHCGSNGGPPRQALTGWADFAKCPPEPSGLREVYFRFDSRHELRAKAVDDSFTAGRVGGTKIGGHAVILSLLFDPEGTVRGIRAVTDPRVTVRERRMAHMLRMRVLAQYDSEGWSCTDLPVAEGETPVGGLFVKNRCEKLSEGRLLVLEGRFYRKPGQLGYDPATDERKEGDFESSTRLEILDPAYAPTRG